MFQINFMKRHNNNEKGVAVLLVFSIIKFLFIMAFFTNYVLVNLFKKLKILRRNWFTLLFNVLEWMMQSWSVIKFSRLKASNVQPSTYKQDKIVFEIKTLSWTDQQIIDNDQGSQRMFDWFFVRKFVRMNFL